MVDKPNEGYGATCNLGLDLATGDYVAIVEPDDYLEPGMPSITRPQTNVMRKMKTVTCSVCTRAERTMAHLPWA